jgi:DNA-binding CsgD family transcriptional regulator
MHATGYTQEDKQTRSGRYQEHFFELQVEPAFLDVLQEKRQLSDPKQSEEYINKNDETLLHILNIIMNSDVLSPHQKEIVEMKSQFTEKDAAEKLGINQSTVNKHIQWIQGYITRFEDENKIRNPINSPARYIKELLLRNHQLYLFIIELLEMEENAL